MSAHDRRPVRLASVAAVAGAVALLATGCSPIQQQIGDAWAVTYEVRVDRPVGADLTGVRVEGAERRGAAPETRDLGSVETGTAADGGSRWTRESVVLAEQRASVRATPEEGATATCRILLVGEREIATETSAAPGRPVRCSVQTPAFD